MNPCLVLPNLITLHEQLSIKATHRTSSTSPPMYLTLNHPSRDRLNQHCLSLSHVARGGSDSEGYEVSVEVTLIPPNHLEPVQRLGAQPIMTSTPEPEGRAFKGAYSFIYFPVPHGPAMHTTPLATSKHDAKVLYCYFLSYKRRCCITHLERDI